MNFSEALNYLEYIREKGTKLTIENIRTVIDHFPFSLDSIRFIQIAGTNGKGSTSHYITSILKESGYKAGMFTSPHLEDIRERITLNKQWISEEDFAFCLNSAKSLSEDLLKRRIIGEIPTYFEHMLLISLFYFHREKVDFAVMEVGLGGRLDATSALRSAVSVITNISHDHTKTLGKNLSQIAAEKAGIIKSGIPVICGCGINTGGHRTIKKIAGEKSAPFYNVIDNRNKISLSEETDFYTASYSSDTFNYAFRVFMKGKHQIINAATAVKTIEILKEFYGLSVPGSAVVNGIEKNSVPGRIELFRIAGGIILDGSHNEASTRALAAFLKETKKKDLTLIFGVLRDKKYRKMIKYLEPFVGNVIVTEPVSERALPAEKLAGFFSQKKVSVQKNLRNALDEAIKLNREILITGSLYLAGAMRTLINGGIKDGS